MKWLLYPDDEDEAEYQPKFSEDGLSIKSLEHDQKKDTKPEEMRFIDLTTDEAP